MAAIDDMSPEQKTLWQRVDELWALSVEQKDAKIRAALHPRYVGWDMTHDLPHDREAAVRSVSAASPRISEYRLEPLSVEVYDHRIGVVHYRYSATVTKDSKPLPVNGKWTEVYLKQQDTWIMIGVSGRPESPKP